MWEIMRRYFSRRLLFSLLAIAVWLSFVTAGTQALYQDGAEIEGNAIRTGSADLQVSTSQQAFTGLFTDEAQGFDFLLLPGTSVERYFFLKNVSPAPISLTA